MKKQLSTDEINILKNLGVSNPDNPSKSDLELYLKALLIDKQISFDASQNFLKNNTDVTLKFLDSLKSVASGLDRTSQLTIDMINNAISIIGKQLDRKLSERERKSINKGILKLVEIAVGVDERSRISGKHMLMIGGGVLVLAAGLTVFIITKGKNPQLLTKGAEVVAKGFRSFH